ncbi:chloride channel protein [Reinekea sp.]|jgi:H+/Cl- antiporter ClcA|uniref:chloride channel protein n=1 Tax=Reinekea sp. TaxID=1970455 RepID=UPI002A8232E1|nr:chloride channel protein [Reinekea sp.]
MPRHSLKHWRLVFFHGNSLALLSFFGILAGVASSLVIAGFMVAVDFVLFLFQGKENLGFAGFSLWQRLLLPIAGALMLIGLYRLSHKKHQDVGITHVIDRLHRGRGKLPLGNTLFQLIAALITLASGFSLGKEGPAVHIGSGMASKLGRIVLRTPSEVRLLIGCGTAAAISSAFGTPLAGVMFAMEVVLMEYSLNGFIPIISASITAAVTSRFLMGEHAALFQIQITPPTRLEIPWLILTGIATGLVAAILHRLIKYFLALNLVRLETRFLLAGLLTGLLGMLVPQVMGLGYDTMNAILTGEFVWWVLLAILMAKIVATAAAVGLGLPAGIVAPSLVVGMASGALVGVLVPGQANDAFYALMGMAGLMSALMHAPLAALTAVLELSFNAEIMFPAMIVVVLANLTCQVLFQQPSIFQTLLSHRGLHITTHPLRNALASRFLTEIATENFSVVAPHMDSTTIAEILASTDRLVVFRDPQRSYLVPQVSLSQQLDRWHLLPDGENLHAFLARVIPERSRISVLDDDASLLEGIRTLQSDDVVGIQVPLDAFRIGLVTRNKLTSVLISTTDGDLH